MVFEALSKGGLIAVTCILFTLQLVAVVTRFIVRKREKVKPWIDDYLALAACVAFFAFYLVTVLVGVTRGSIGQHVVVGPGGPELPNYTTFATQFVFVAFYTWVIGPARLSLIFLYRRVFVGRAMRIITNVLTTITIAWIVTFTILLIYASSVHCTPDGKRFASLTSLEPPCMDTIALFQSLAITDVLFDLIILVLPWPWVRKLHMHRRQKVGIVFVFLLGNITLAASIVRCYFLFWTVNQIGHGNDDLTHFDGINLIWGQTESATAIICSCLPNFGRVILKRLPSWTTTIPSYVRSLFRDKSSITSSSGRTQSTQSGESSKQQSKKGSLDASTGKPPMVITQKIEFGFERV